MIVNSKLTPRIRLILVDDHPLVRDGLRARLEVVPRIEVVGEADNGANALELAEQIHPDLMLVDIGMKEMNGIQLTHELTQRHPKIRVLILSMHDSSACIASAVRAGARGYVLKDADSREIIAAIDAVSAGGNYYSQHVTRALITPPSIDSLTDREREVLILIAQGLCNKTIATRLHISARTVETHRLSLRRKLRIESAAGLAKYAIEQGLTMTSGPTFNT